MSWHAFRGHFRTITRHRHMVIRHCRKAGILWQGLRHDLSKYSPTEFFAGVRYYQDGKRSPNEAEREALGYSLAWMHHKGRNRHHWEYWVDIKGNGDPTMEGKPMPTRYVVEMFCDRIAASRVYKKDAYTDRSPLEYYELEHSAPVELPIHPMTEALLKRLLEMLAERGEEAALAYVKREIVRKRYVEGPGCRF